MGGLEAKFQHLMQDGVLDQPGVMLSTKFKGQYYFGLPEDCEPSFQLLMRLGYSLCGHCIVCAVPKGRNIAPLEVVLRSEMNRSNRIKSEKVKVPLGAAYEMRRDLLGGNDKFCAQARNTMWELTSLRSSSIPSKWTWPQRRRTKHQVGA